MSEGLPMGEKHPAKSKRLVQADLNFIANKPLENIIWQLNHLEYDTVTPYVVRTDENTALFRLVYHRGERVTAEIAGRLQRWAGDMTHVYCDGRTFYKMTSYLRALLRWCIFFALISPLLTCPLVIFASEANQTGLMDLFALSMLLFSIVAIAYGVRTLGTFIYRYITSSRGNSKSGLEKPEKKDRERLLHILTEIIRDEDYAHLQQVADDQTGQPLTEAEAKALIEHAEMLSRIGKL
jgi:hypothetical protein